MNLKDVFLFKDLSEKELEEIKKISVIEDLKKGEFVFMEGDEPIYLHILLLGEAKVFKTDKKGNELVIHRFRPISLIAELANLQNVNFPASCIMETDGIILKIKFEPFKKFIKHGSICIGIMSSLIRKLQYLEQVINNNLILDTETKIAKFIYENEDLFHQLKQHHIASLLNITPETLSRKLKKFKKLGIIESHGSKLIVKDKEKILKFFQW